jgi:CubicO group peptidase (beta-lactamase class C family)
MSRSTPSVLTDSRSVSLTNWLEPPHNRWSLHHVEEIVATAQISRGVGSTRPLPELKQDLSQVRLGTAGPGAGWTMEDFLEATSTDGLLVLRGENIVYERYFSDSTASTKHLAMSVSKSICGMLAGVLVAEGLLDLQATVASYIPELSKAAHAQSTITQLLDMTSSLRFDMDYPNPDSDVQTEDRCTGWRPSLPGDPAGTRAFLAGLQADIAHGEVFQYCSATTDVLAWVLERASGLPYARLVQERIWSRIGAEHDAYVCVDDHDTPYACAGLGMTLRDLARFGRMILDGGTSQGREVIPTDWIIRTRDDCSNDVGLSSEFADFHAAGAYRNQWWITGDERGSFYGRGIFGQYLWLDPTSDVIIAKFSSQPGQRDQVPEHVAALGAIAAAAGAPTRSPDNDRISNGEEKQ